jgi:signal transduction histidine kinase
MIPMTAVMLATVVGLSLLNAYVASRRAVAVIEQRLQGIARTLEQSTFPLTNPVLQQMRGLAGADFILVDQQGRIAAGTRDDQHDIVWPAGDSTDAQSPLRLGARLRLGDLDYLHAAVRIRRSGDSAPKQLHVLYPVQAYREVWWQAARPPLLIGGVSLLVVAGLAAWIAGRVSRPLSQLRTQVERITDGTFAPVPVPSRHDEVRDLAVSVNSMAARLTEYEQQVRTTERLRALGQLSGGLAHQLRNAATGARLAIDFHRAECPRGHECESLAVAIRQLELMERYLRKLLALGEPQQHTHQTLDFVALVDNVVALVRPAARHAHVELDVQMPDHPQYLDGESDGLEHVVLNLLLNAIEAAAAARSNPVGPVTPARVRLSLVVDRDCLRMTVADSGAGPSARVQSRLFEPFASDKPDGAGLGLALAKRVVERHGGTIYWSRVDNETHFQVDLPLNAAGSPRVEVACR